MKTETNLAEKKVESKMDFIKQIIDSHFENAVAHEDEPSFSVVIYYDANNEIVYCLNTSYYNPDNDVTGTCLFIPEEICNKIESETGLNMGEAEKFVISLYGCCKVVGSVTCNLAN